MSSGVNALVSVFFVPHCSAIPSRRDGAQVWTVAMESLHWGTANSLQAHCGGWKLLGERDLPVPDYDQFESMSEVILSSSGKTARSSYPPSKDGLSLEKRR